MRRLYRILTIIAVLIFIPVLGGAQQLKSSLSGRIFDNTDTPIAYASVAVYDGEKPIAGTVTDNDGKFALKVVQNNNELQLIVEFIGYTRYSQKFTTQQQTINFGKIILNEETIMLQEATVTAKQASQKSTIAHTTINASSNMVSDKGTALDILRNASAVTVSNEEISIRGNSNILVLMDGIPTSASDLSTIPANSIKSIEVITNPDASYDASGTGGIINIISKKTSLEGFSGMVSANYGFNHFATAGAALSYNKPKSSYRFSYNTKYEDDEINTTLQRMIKGSGTTVFQQMTAMKYTSNNNWALGADFRVNSKNRLGIELKGILPRINIQQEINNTITENNGTARENRYNDVTWNRENVEGSVSYTRAFKPEVSELAVVGSVSKIWGHRPSYYYTEGNMTNRSNSGGSPFVSSLQADYKYKLKTGTLSAGAKITYRHNNIYHQFYQMDGNEWIYSQAMSNDLLHTETVPAAYIMFASRAGKKFTYKAGIRAEHSTVTLTSNHDTTDQSNHSIFIAPTISGTYRISEKQDISLALSRRTGRPTYPQLNPYMSMVDAITYEQGNMFLQPETSTKLDLAYNLKDNKYSMFLNVYTNYTKDYISQITMIDEGKLITTYVNASSDIKYGMDISVNFNPVKWANISLTANTYYTSTEGKAQSAEISNKGVTNNSNLMLNFLPGKGTDIQCQYFITTPQYFPQLTTSLTHQMNVGVKQKIMKGAMTLSLLLTDVMNTNEWKITSNNNIFDLTNISRNKSRMLWLGITYNFNSFKQKQNQKKETDRSLIKLGL